MAKSGFNPANLMQSMGWTPGKGLGRIENGRTEAIKAVLKKDVSGLGFDQGKQFTDHWWNHVFNSAANNIQTSSTEGTVQISTKQEFVSKSNKAELVHVESYARFQNSATMKNGVLIEAESALNSSDSSESEDKPETIQGLSDEQLFAACGGRTAHKGARHGHKMNGKLARIEAAERALLEAYNASRNTGDMKATKHKSEDYLEESMDSKISEPSKKKKKKKDKRNESNDDIELQDETESDKKKKKKKKDKRKQVELDNCKVNESEATSTLQNPTLQNTVEIDEECKVSSKKKKKGKRTKRRKRAKGQKEEKGQKDKKKKKGKRRAQFELEEISMTYAQEQNRDMTSSECSKESPKKRQRNKNNIENGNQEIFINKSSGVKSEFSTTEVTNGVCEKTSTEVVGEKEVTMDSSKKAKKSKKNNGENVVGIENEKADNAGSEQSLKKKKKKKINNKKLL